MKTIIVVVLFVSVLIPIYECAVGYARNATHPDYPGKCYVAIKDHPPLIITPGNAKKDPTQCLRYSCSPDFSLQFASCGVYSPFPHCWIVNGDESKPYPGCCTEVIC